MAGADYVKDVTCKTPFILAQDDPANHNTPYLPVGTTMNAPGIPCEKIRVAAFDYGAKHSIYRKLVNHGFEVQVFPGARRTNKCVSTNRRGVPLERPGDPAALPYIHKTVTGCCRIFPIFGIAWVTSDHARARRFDVQAEVRPSRRQPAGEKLETGKVPSRANHGFATDPKSVENHARSSRKSA